MALFQTAGKIFWISEVTSGTGKSGYQWQRQSVVLEVAAYNGSYFKQAFEANGSMVNELASYKPGDLVSVSFSLYAREWQGKWYNTVEIVRIAPQGTQTAPAVHAPVQPPVQAPAQATEPVAQIFGTPTQDDLPF